MWSFEEDGSFYHEKAILFMEHLFDRWTKIGTNHLVSMVLFSRVYYDEKEKDEVPPPVLIDTDGRAYKDFYKVIVDLEPISHPHKVLDEVRQEIFNFQKHILTFVDAENQPKLAGRLSHAPEGNILEAMGIACNSFDEHYIDRDLRRTGVSIVFVTAGTCVYHVDQMLLRLATERFVAHGIGVDFVSLSKIPLHVVPLFRFVAPDLDPAAQSTKNRAIDPSFNPIYIDPTSPHSNKSVHYSVPFFVDCSFFLRHQDRPFRIDRFMPRCRMPAIQNGIGEHDLTGISIPLLSETLPPGAMDDDAQTRKSARQRFDAQVVDASMIPLQPLRPKKSSKQQSGSRTVVDSLVVTAIETNRKPSMSKYDENNRSPLLKATIPQGTTDFSQLANQPSASLSLVPASGSGSSRGRAASASTTGSSSGKTATPALIARLTGLSQPQRSFWPWSTAAASSAMKTETLLPSSTVNRASSPPETSHQPRREESSSTHTPSRESSVARGARDAKLDAVRIGRSEPARSATSLMPFINAPRRTVSSSSTQYEVLSADSSAHDNSPKKSKTRQDFVKFNPSNPSSTSSSLLSQFRRWSAIFPRRANDQRSVKWKSLCTPACLPITTDFCPSQTELNNSYMLTEYEFPISASSMLVKSSDASFSAEESMRIRAAATLREAISQRLSQCFQLVIPELASHVTELAPSSRPYWLSLVGIIKEAEKGSGGYVDLSLSDHYHRLSIRGLDTGSPTLCVQLYTRHRNWMMEPFVYRSAIWRSSEQAGWDEFVLKFNFPNLDSFDFRGLDKIIVGVDRGIHLNEDLRYWRSRAVFLPNTVSANFSGSIPKCLNKGVATEDETRLAGMMKLQTSLRNVNWLTSSDVIMPSVLTLDFTSADASQHVRHESERLVAFASVSRDQRDKAGRILNLRDPLPVIAEAMWHPTDGIEVKSQLIQLRLTENVFQGDKLVTFLKHKFNFNTREEALNFGRQLESKGMFRDATNGNQPRPLIDSNRYYQLSSEYCPAKPTRTWFGRTINEKVMDKANSSTLKNATAGASASSGEEKKRSSSASRLTRDKSIITMTRVGIIDLDPTGKSDRSEKAIIHCDISHSPSNAWHVEIQWLGITAALVDGLLQQWSRIVERYGIKMVEQNVRTMEDLSDFSPLQKTMVIPLACKPPALEALAEMVPITTSPNCYLEGQLLRSQGFVIDVESDQNFPAEVNIVYSYRRQSFPYTQFIHSTGAALVQVRDGCFVWADNLAARISANRRVIGGGGNNGTGLRLSGFDTAELRRSLISLCSDEVRLESFWDKCLAKLCEGKSREEETKKK